MKTLYINYADKNYEKHQNWLLDHVTENAIFDSATGISREWLETTEYYKENKSILDRDRLAGYAIWKPYIIREAMKYVEDGDIVVYMDCGDIPYVGINEEVKRYMSTHDQYFLSQNHTGVHQWFCKRDCFVLMGCDEPLYHKSLQLEDGFMAFKKTEYNLNLLDEFIKYCCDERCVTDIPNTCGLPNLDGFQDHRHDQAIITNLQLKYNLPRVEGHTGVRHFIKWNTLIHKDGEQFSNGSYDWGETGCIA